MTTTSNNLVMNAYTQFDRGVRQCFKQIAWEFAFDSATKMPELSGVDSTGRTEE